MAKVLIVDDEDNILELLRYNLEKDGHELSFASDGNQALELVGSFQPDVILLDLMLPEISGLDVCRKVKANPTTADMAIIMVTAKKDEIDKVLGLEIGADDYVTKPFSVREILARIKAVLRRSKGSSPSSEQEQEELTAGPIVIRPEKYQVEAYGEPKELTPKEFQLLYYLIKNRGKVMKREILLERIWGYEAAADTRTVDVHVRYLRQKLEQDAGKPKFIETVRGVGYRFTEDI